MWVLSSWRPEECWIPQSWGCWWQTELGSSARVALTLNSWALFPTPQCVFICISLMTGGGEHFSCVYWSFVLHLLRAVYSFHWATHSLDYLIACLKRMLSPSPPYPIFHEWESWGLGLCGVTVSSFHLIKSIPQPQSRFTQGRCLY